MNYDNHGAKETYVQLLCDVLNKKLEVLNLLMTLTQKQEGIINADQFDEDQFETLMDQKDTLLETLSKLDIGFEQIYEGVREEISANKEKYKDEIITLQTYIASITEINVKLQALEKRNKAKIETIFISKRKEIKSSRVNNQTATNYYKTMANQHEAQSYFYDKKN